MRSRVSRRNCGQKGGINAALTNFPLKELQGVFPAQRLAANRFFDLSTGVSPINPTIYPQEISLARWIFLAAKRAACNCWLTVRRLRTWTGARPLEPERIGSGRQFQEGEQGFGDRADEEGFSDQSSTASEPWSLRGGESRGSLHNRAGHPSGRKARGRRQGVPATARCKDRVQAPDAFLILMLVRQRQRARAMKPGPRQRQAMHPRPTHLWAGVYTHIL